MKTSFDSTDIIMQDVSHKLTELGSSIQYSSVNVTNLIKNANEINNMVSTINGISEQTNLLALNAAIEAARAGEAGRGFAVVADEVRSLASSTRQTTDDIQRLLGEINSNSKFAAESMENSSTLSEQVGNSFTVLSQSFTTTFESLENLNTINDQVYVRAEDQNTAAVQVRKNIHHIFSLLADAQQTTEMTEKNVEKLEIQASDLDSVVANYSVNTDSPITAFEQPQIESAEDDNVDLF